MIHVIGIGPGDSQYMTYEARQAIEAAEVVVGYDVYVDLIRPLIAGKEIVTTGMTQEVDRCRKALRMALDGKRVCLVCSGDAGVYGMAGVMLEVAGDSDIEITIIPGVTAALATAARLGAPITHDFAVISLSDLLTPWAAIAKRLKLAAEADFVICIYNPRSKKRKEHLSKAVNIMLEHKSADTPCGYVKNAGRANELVRLCQLSTLAEEDIDMFSTIIIGNSATKVLNGRLVTPRGYTDI
jgi:precorrin-3B C17-methyltransferase